MGLKPKGTTEIYINPPVLNLSSNRRYVTMHIEPSGEKRKVVSARITSVNGTSLSDPISSIRRPKPGDHDEDGTMDYMVKFPFNKLSSYLKDGKNEITVEADIQGGSQQTGTGKVSVKTPPKANNAAVKVKKDRPKKKK
jgi:hypothetical protein